ncbi:MAG: class A beta-lactamase-related serine hydrolase, partial [Candidatus Omnitrophica bacterium]|nr:class A beta-lactamase-related serine hydrolase [Candidatus Omnitrophota bacterium]
MIKNKIKKIIFFLTIFLILISILGFKIKEYKKYTLWHQKRKQILQRLQDEILMEVSSFNQKYSVFIKDLNTNYKISLNEDVVFPSASLIKIPIMGCVFCADRDNIIRLNDKIVIKDTDKTEGSGILKNLPSGTTLDIEDLIHLMISQSDNTATNILIDLLGFEYLNHCFKKL